MISQTAKLGKGDIGPSHSDHCEADQAGPTTTVGRTMVSTHPIPPTMPALVTPFDTAGDIDLGAHRANITTLTARGVTGFLVAGSTGEGPYLVEGERSGMLEVARDAAPEAFLMCGVAAQSVAQAAGQIAELELADAALVVTPTMFVATIEDQVRFYSAVAESSPLPVWLYTVPGVTGYNLPVEAVTELADLPNVVGIKDSSGIVERIAEMRRGCPDDFLIYVGASRAVAAARRLGADGAITASGNYAWGLVDDIVRHDPEDPAAEVVQQQLTDLAAIVEQHGLRGTKAAASLTGIEAGMPRSPLDPLNPEAAAALATALGGAV